MNKHFVIAFMISLVPLLASQDNSVNINNTNIKRLSLTIELPHVTGSPFSTPRTFSNRGGTPTKKEGFLQLTPKTPKTPKTPRTPKTPKSDPYDLKVILQSMRTPREKSLRVLFGNKTKIDDSLKEYGVELVLPKAVEEKIKKLNAAMSTAISSPSDQDVTTYLNELQTTAAGVKNSHIFDTESIQHAIATIPTCMTSRNMRAYIEQAKESNFGGLALNMLLAKVIELQKRQCISLESPRESFSCLRRRHSTASIMPQHKPLVQVAQIPEGFHPQLAKLYFLMTGFGLDFADELYEQPECSFSIEELYQWGRLPQTISTYRGQIVLDLSRFRMSSFKGMELLPYLRKLTKIRLAEHKHLLVHPQKSDDDKHEHIILCGVAGEEQQLKYPRNHKFDHVY